MIEICVGEVVAMLPIVDKVATERIPARAAWQLSQIIARLRAEADAFERARLELFKALGEPSTDGNGYTVPAERVPSLNTELQKLMEKRLQIDAAPVSIAQLDGALFAAADLLQCQPLFEDS